MTYVYQGHIEKIPILEEILTRSGIAASRSRLHRRRSHRRGGDESSGAQHRARQCAARGEALRSARHRERRRSGAVREVCELLLKAQGHWDDLLKKYEIAK